MQRNILLIVRNDVAVSVRALVATSLGFDVTNWLGSRALRRTADTPGTTSHRAAHGVIPESLWDDLVGILTTATEGIRDAQDWQGKPGTDLVDARWAIATDAGDLVAAYRTTRTNATWYENPVQAIYDAGFAFTNADADAGTG